MRAGRVLRRVSLVAVMVMLGGVLALCCCTDGPTDTVSHAPGSDVALAGHHVGEVGTSAAAHGAGSRLAPDHLAPSPSRSGAAPTEAVTGAAADMTAPVPGRGGDARRAGTTDTCGSPAVLAQASVAPTAITFLHAPTAPVAAATQVLPTVHRAGADSEDLPPPGLRPSPYLLCVMRT
ncbi:hypothetical protein GCM10023215_39050 [Pseudonocardia yuanmonensis]|uniref:Uncharacterized protein n=1 Tax=Pseudonocardia yuanmonensis TaxID=1095914 RepID=A0ABP8WXB6_9PSEU